MSNDISKRPSIYPRGLFLGSTLAACNLIGLGALNAILVLYCIKQLNISVHHTYTIYAAFGALYYSAALVGGYLGGRYDYKLAVILGSILAAVGAFFMTVPTTSFLFLGLASFIMGCSLVVPNLFCIIGKLYSKDDKHRASGFTIVYSLMNLGGAVAAFSVGFIAEHYSFSLAFAIMGIILTLAFFLFVLGYHRFDFYHDEKTPAYKANITVRNTIITLATVAVAIPLATLLLHYAQISNILLLISGGIVVIFLMITAFKQETKEARLKLMLFLMFLVIGVAFWSLYMLMPSALIVFNQHNLNRYVAGIQIPAGSIYALDPFFILMFGPILSFILVWLTQRKINLSLPVKFALGMIFMGGGYLILVVGIHFADVRGYTALWWSIVCYLLLSFGELFVGPTSYAMVGTLCPASLEGTMMGVFRLSIGVAGAFSGFLAAATTPVRKNISNPLLTNHVFSHAFTLFGGITLGMGVLVLLILAPIVRKLVKQHQAA